jgi:hypothetical protein
MLSIVEIEISIRSHHTHVQEHTTEIRRSLSREGKHRDVTREQCKWQGFLLESCQRTLDILVNNVLYLCKKGDDDDGDQAAA